MQAVTIGLDIAKSVFQVHGVDADGRVIIRRQLKRRYVPAFFDKLAPYLIGMEACASSHYWSRQLQAIFLLVVLMSPIRRTSKGLRFATKGPRRRVAPPGFFDGDKQNNCGYVAVNDQRRFRWKIIGARVRK
jgi:transposase